MNSQFLYEYASVFERVLSVGYERHYATPALERLIAYSLYFQRIETDDRDFAPIVNDAFLIRAFFPDFDIDLSNLPSYNQCLWAAEAYLRIQGETRLTFECIFLYIPINKMYDYFPLYHEMDFSRIVDEFKRLFAEKSVLGTLVEKYHYSLTDIAKRLGVSYGLLSSLKQRKRDIKKTSVEIAVKLSHVFRVRVETLAETAA